jgi:hypothetical protein
LDPIQAVVREVAQILPNIPLTILQLSFDRVKGNLNRQSCRGVAGEHASGMTLRSIVAEAKRGAEPNKNSTGFLY